MKTPSGYLITSYGDMVSCEPRMSAYAEALRQSITPGCTVIDIGAGFGIFSLLACKFGASQVIAIEPNDVAALIEPMAEANDCASQLRAVQGLSSDFDEAVKADVIISDLRSCLPLFEGHIASIVDARERLLAPHGQLIPARDQLRIALANHPQTYRTHREPWLRNNYGVDLSAGHRFAANQWLKVHLKPDDLLSQAQDLALLDYATIVNPDLETTATLVADRDGEVQGLLVWFDSELVPGIGFSNAPGEPKLIYGQNFFPLERPLSLLKGDRVDVEINAHLIAGSYVWSWNTRLRTKDPATPEIALRQSDFLAKVLSPRKLTTRSPSFVPLAQKSQLIDRHCLDMFDGEKSLGEIAHRLQTDFPGVFANSVDAVNHVADLAERYRHPSAASADLTSGKEPSE